MAGHFEQDFYRCVERGSETAEIVYLKLDCISDGTDGKVCAKRPKALKT